MADEEQAAQMAALGLPTNFAKPGRAAPSKTSSLATGANSTRIERSTAPPNAPEGPKSMTAGASTTYSHVSFSGNDVQARPNKRFRDTGRPKERASGQKEEHYHHLRLDEIPTQALIRRSFTEEPWAHLI